MRKRTQKNFLSLEIEKVLETLARSQRVSLLGKYRRAKSTAFEVLIAAVLSTRTRDKTTQIVCKRLFEKYPEAKSLASARLEDVMNIIKSIGFYRQKSKSIINTAKIIAERFQGRVPDSFEELIKLPGVGRKVANCVLVYGFGKKAIPVDTHVHRVCNRLGWVKTTSAKQTELALMRLVPCRWWTVINEVFVTHGKNVCRPVNPMCSVCEVRIYCNLGKVLYKDREKSVN